MIHNNVYIIAIILYTVVQYLTNHHFIYYIFSHFHLQDTSLLQPMNQMIVNFWHALRSLDIKMWRDWVKKTGIAKLRTTQEPMAQIK